MKKKILIICLISGILIVFLKFANPSLESHKAFIKENFHNNLLKAKIQNKSPKYDMLDNIISSGYYPAIVEKSYHLFSIGKIPIEGKYENVTLGIAGFIIPLNNFDVNKSYNKSIFEVNIVSNKNEYYQLEPVWITIQIKNISPNVDSVDIHGNIDLLKRFQVTDENGNQLKGHYPLIDYGSGNFIKINGHEQISYDVELSTGFSENNLGEHMSSRYSPISYFSKGIYSVILNFYNTYDAKEYELFQSNKINFEVNSPENDELKIFNKLLEIIKIYDVEHLSWENYINDLNKLYDENQNSIYSEEIFYNCIYFPILFQVGPTNNENRNMFNEKFVERCKVFLNKHPNSFYSEEILNHLLPRYANTFNKSKQDVINFLNELIDKHPNTKIQSAALKYKRDKKYTD